MKAALDSHHHADHLVAAFGKAEDDLEGVELERALARLRQPQ
jgi:hypothetical protein